MISQSRLFSVSFIPCFGYYDLFMDIFVVILFFTILIIIVKNKLLLETLFILDNM